MSEIVLYLYSDNSQYKFHISCDSLLTVIDNPNIEFPILKEKSLKVKISANLVKKLNPSSSKEIFLVYTPEPEDSLYIHIPEHYDATFRVFGEYKTKLLLYEAKMEIFELTQRIKEKDEIIKQKDAEIAELNLLPDAPGYYQLKAHFENLSKNAKT